MAVVKGHGMLDVACTHESQLAVTWRCTKLEIKPVSNKVHHREKKAYSGSERKCGVSPL